MLPPTIEPFWSATGTNLHNLQPCRLLWAWCHLFPHQFPPGAHDGCGQGFPTWYPWDGGGWCGSKHQTTTLHHVPELVENALAFRPVGHIVLKAFFNLFPVGLAHKNTALLQAVELGLCLFNLQSVCVCANSHCRMLSWILAYLLFQLPHLGRNLFKGKIGLQRCNSCVWMLAVWLY